MELDQYSISEHVGMLDNLTDTAKKLIAVGAFVAAVDYVLTTYSKLGGETSLILSIMAVFVLGFFYHENQIEKIKEQIKTLKDTKAVATKRKGAMTFGMAVIVVAIILIILLYLLQLRSG